MGLFGALFAGVSGLDSQSNKIGIISNNISNVNTVGYKQGQADFDTLVVSSGTTAFSPGGVLSSNNQLVNQQGIISATTSDTDIAVSGNGMIPVNTKPDGSGQELYTRAGDFTQDSEGNFVNSDGFYLQALPVSEAGVTAETNPQNLVTATVNASATGSATATSAITTTANLNSTQAVLLGPGETTGITGTDTTNVNNTGTQIIAPSATNGLGIDSQITISSTGSAGVIPTQKFTYGGFTYGRDVTAAIGTTGTSVPLTQGTDTDANSTLNTITNATMTTTNGSNVVSFTPTNAALYPIGSTVSISGVSATTDGIPANDLNGDWTVTYNSGGVIKFDVGANATSTDNTQTATLSNRTYNFGGNVLDATTDAADFLGTSGVSNFASNALSFTIGTGGTTSTFTYNAVPNTSNGQFDSLDTLATAISNTSGLTASVVNHQLYVSATDANQAVVFANVNAAGTPVTNGTNLYGINWTQELGLKDIPASATGSHTFNSLSGLSAQINAADPTNLVSTVNNPTSTSPTIAIHEANPLQTIQISDGTNTGTTSLLKELSMTANHGAALTGTGTALSTGVLPATYDPTDTTRNMSSGAVTPQYSKDVTVYDAQGNSHTLALNFAKLNTNTWAVEATVVPATDAVTATKDGQVASGTLTFGGDGSLLSATGSISSPSGFAVDWTNKASASQITMNLGVGTNTGIIQTDSAFNFSNATQNGSSVGELTGVSIDANGFITAAFSNGQTQKLYQIPLASINNPNGMTAVSGNSYAATIASGTANLQIAGTSGVGDFTPSALEQSNVDLSTQLTDLIVAQQAYGANSKVLTVADSLLQELDQIIQ